MGFAKFQCGTSVNYPWARLGMLKLCSSLEYCNCWLRVGLIESSICPDMELLMQVRSSWYRFIPLYPLFLFRGPSMSCLSGFCMFWMLLFRQSALITAFWEHPLVQQSHLCTGVPNKNSYQKFNGGEAGTKILVGKRLKENGSDFFVKQQMVHKYFQWCWILDTLGWEFHRTVKLQESWSWKMPLEII